MSYFLEPIRALNVARVDYVVVGGLAVVLHGHPRLTVDVDIVVALDSANALKAVRALMDIGLKPRSPVDPLLFADEEVRRTWIEEKGLAVFSFIDPINPFVAVDLFVKYPMPYEELSLGSTIKDLHGVPVRVCSVEALIQLKRATGRPTDLIDIATLEDINGNG